MSEEEYRLFIERQRFMGLNYVRRYAARTAIQLGLASSYDEWLRQTRFDRDLSAFRTRWVMAMTPILPPYAFPIVGIAGV